jgi:hypothetical protein
MNVFISNTNMITLKRLRSVMENAYIDDADVTLTVVDKASGDPIALPEGTEWPIDLEPSEASPQRGDYVGIIPAEVEFEPNGQYIAVVEVDAGLGRVGHWEIPFVARVRVQA